MNSKRENWEIAITSIGIIIFTIVIVVLVKSTLREPVYKPNSDQKGAAEEAVQRR